MLTGLYTHVGIAHHCKVDLGGYEMAHWRGMSKEWNDGWPASYGLRLDVVEAVEVFHGANEGHIAQVSEWGAELPNFLLPNEQVLVVAAGYEQGRRAPRECILTLTCWRFLVKNTSRDSIALGDVETVGAGPSSPFMYDSPLEIRYGGASHHFRLWGQDTADRFADRIARAIETNRG